MSVQSAIEWCDATWNPVRGCVKVSPGCKHCYAETFAERFRGVAGHPYEQGFDPRLVPKQLAAPLGWKKPKTIFVNSMSDLFGDFVPDEYIAACFGVMAATPRHTYQVLTKRAERLLKWARWLDVATRGYLHGRVGCVVDHAEKILGEGALDGAWEDTIRAYHGAADPKSIGDAIAWPWPLPNVWLGVSVENQKAAEERIPHLLRAPAAVRFLSIEPLLEDLGPLDLKGIHWVIVGGESGPGARACRLEWIRSIVEQARSANIPVFVKQLGADPRDGSGPGSFVKLRLPDGKRDRKGKTMAAWPEDLRMQEMPNRLA